MHNKREEERYGPRELLEPETQNAKWKHPADCSRGSDELHQCGSKHSIGILQCQWLRTSTCRAEQRTLKAAYFGAGWGRERQATPRGLGNAGATAREASSTDRPRQRKHCRWRCCWRRATTQQPCKCGSPSRTLCWRGPAHPGCCRWAVAAAFEYGARYEVSCLQWTRQASRRHCQQRRSIHCAAW